MSRHVGLATLALALVAGPGRAEDRGQTDPTEWRYWGGSAGGVRFSPLELINRENVGKLERAWTYDAGEIALGRDQPAFKAGFTTTPLVVGGVLYLSTPSSRVIALEPETGRQLWIFDPQAGKPVREWNAHRGVSYWESRVRAGKPCERRILLGTVDSRLMAIDAGTGKPCADFGRGGAVDLRAEDGNRFREELSFGSRITAPPAIYKDIVITGRALQESPGRGPNGDVRAYDVRTGRPVWRFHTVPRPGEFGHDTWDEQGWQDRSGVNVWSVMSVDTERGLVFLPIGSPASDFFAETGRGRTCSATPSSLSTRRRAGGGGTFRWSTTISGTTTCPPSPCS
jgi:quinate dehydrogenase (quinone)